MTRVLVTGAAGFVGRHLCAHLERAGHEVHGLGRTPPERWKARWHTADVADEARLHSILAATHPDLVFHLAAQIGGSFAEMLAVNADGTRSLLAAIAAETPDARVVVTGSAAEYGPPAREALPLRERQPLRPLTLYGVSKAAQSLVAAQFALRSELAVLRTRTFNLSGPGEPDTLVAGAFARQIAEIEAGVRPPVLHVGNLASSRDFLDVRDAVHAYLLLAERGEPGELYNVSSGRAVVISDVLNALLALAHVAPAIEIDPARIAAPDIPLHYGDSTKLRRATGWAPERELEKTLSDLLDDWRRRVTV